MTESGPAAGSTGALRADRDEVAALRNRDQGTFRSLVRRLHPTMVRVARSYVSSGEVAEEVAQDTWVAVLEEVDRFEGRSSLRTWILRILVNQAKTRGVREKRTTPFSALAIRHEMTGSAVPEDLFFESGHRWAGHWATAVPSWDLPEERLLSAELGSVLRDAVDQLPRGQRAVVALRDGLGLSAGEVCTLLELSETNQRVLLHRGRARVREAVAEYAGRVRVRA